MFAIVMFVMAFSLSFASRTATGTARKDMCQRTPTSHAWRSRGRRSTPETKTMTARHQQPASSAQRDWAGRNQLVEYNSRRTRGAGLYQRQCQNGYRQSDARVTKWRRADVPE